MDKLPEDTLIDIMEYVGGGIIQSRAVVDDQKSLCNAALACRRFLEPSQRIIFHTVLVDLGEKALKLLSVFQATPHLASFVKNFFAAAGKRVSTQSFSLARQHAGHLCELLQAISSHNRIETFLFDSGFDALVVTASPELEEALKRICQSANLKYAMLYHTPLSLLDNLPPSLVGLRIECPHLAPTTQGLASTPRDAAKLGTLALKVGLCEDQISLHAYASFIEDRFLGSNPFFSLAALEVLQVSFNAGQNENKAFGLPLIKSLLDECEKTLEILKIDFRKSWARTT